MGYHDLEDMLKADNAMELSEEQEYRKYLRGLSPVKKSVRKARIKRNKRTRKAIHRILKSKSVNKLKYHSKEKLVAELIMLWLDESGFEFNGEDMLIDGVNGWHFEKDGFLSSLIRVNLGIDIEDPKFASIGRYLKDLRKDFRGDYLLEYFTTWDNERGGNVVIDKKTRIDCKKLGKAELQKSRQYNKSKKKANKSFNKEMKKLFG